MIGYAFVLHHISPWHCAANRKVQSRASRAWLVVLSCLRSPWCRRSTLSSVLDPLRSLCCFEVAPSFLPSASSPPHHSLQLKSLHPCPFRQPHPPSLVAGRQHASHMGILPAATLHSPASLPPPLGYPRPQSVSRSCLGEPILAQENRERTRWAGAGMQLRTRHGSLRPGDRNILTHPTYRGPKGPTGWSANPTWGSGKECGGSSARPRKRKERREWERERAEGTEEEKNGKVVWRTVSQSRARRSGDQGPRNIERVGQRVALSREAGKHARVRVIVVSRLQ